MTKKKVGKIILYIIIALLIVFSCYYFWSFFAKGKQRITVKTSTSYYSGTDINATIAVTNTDTYKSMESKITANLYDDDNKKVKDISAKCEIEKGEEGEISLSLPKDLESGKYTLKVKSKSGFYSDTAEIPITIVNDIKSNVIISLDKGIYKPGDEIKFRVLMVSKKENEPVSQNIKVSIYDGNDNRVYINEAMSSEYGIVSGNFKLADEVNSGTYRIKVETGRQEVSKNFTVNPYITPNFEVSVSTDKEAYIVGETAKITVSGKYFFGEPVKNAEIKGTINEKDVVGITDENGNFVFEHEFKEASKIVTNFSVTDSSNYLAQESKTIFCGTDLYEVEVIPEYSEIAQGIDNDIYVITKEITGIPIKTYSTVKIGNVSKQVISDENGIGKITLTASETEGLNSTGYQEITVESEDMNGNKVSKDYKALINSNFYTLIKTDKVKYNVGDDIEITVNSKVDTNTKNIYVFKADELVKTIATDEESVKINLENISGIVDIYVPNTRSNSVSFYNYNSLANYSKKTIFIKPNKELNISVEPSKEEYKPGDTLDVKFVTTNESNEKVDSALLVSILDEAILSLAENDLSIDNIKLALEDIVLDDGMTAADLYAMAIDESSDLALNSVLLKQKITAPNIVNKTYKNTNTDQYLALGIMSTLVWVILIIFRIISKKKEKFAKVFVPIIDVCAIVILMALYAFEVFDIMSNGFTVFTLLVLAIIAYLLFLYKERDFIFKMIAELIVVPLFALIGVYLISGIFTLIFDSYIDEMFALILGVLILLTLLEFAILKSLSRKKELNKVLTKIYEFTSIISKAVVFWISTIALSEITEFGLLIVIAVYFVYRKFILKETKTKLQDGKIVLNLNASELAGMLVGVLLIVIVIIMTFTSNFAGNITVNDSMSMGEFVPGTGTVMDFSDVSVDSAMNFATDAIGASKSESTTSSFFDFDISQDSKLESSVTEEIALEDGTVESETEKEIDVEDNVRNIFLESLAFIPELVTENGEAKLSTQISDNITTWNIQTVGNTKDGNIGYAAGSFKVFKEFFIDYTLPANSVVTDKVSIPVTLYNYTENKLTINLNVKENDWMTIGGYENQVSVEPNSSKMIYLPIEILKAGNNTLRIESKAGEISDIVEKTLVVKPNGFEKNDVVSSGMIENKYSQDIIFNEKAIDETQKIKVKLYASPVAQIIENIDAMLKMPTGCFEQTSSSLYPDILVLKYLRENDLNNSELEEKALEYISKGYQKLLTYEVKSEKGGYSLYGDAPAEPVITAFGLMEFNELSEVYPVEESVLMDMIEYLFDVQNVNGTFDYNSTYIGGAASNNDLAMNAYITWALSEVTPRDERLEKSVSYFENKIDEISDNYTLALLANIFANTENKNLANEVLKMINQNIQTSENGAYITSGITDYYGTRGKYQNIQATALTSMALTKLNSNEKNNSEFIKFLVSQKDARGSWGTTQGTILALKAINSYSQNSDLKNQTITVKLNDQEQKINIKENALDVYELEFDNVSKENRFSIDMKKGKLTYEIIKNYYQKYDDLEKNENLVVTQNIRTIQTVNEENQTINTNVFAKVNDILTQTITVKNNDEYIENGLLEINIPQGTTPIEESLLNLKYKGLIEKYEYNYNKINIYLRSFEVGEETTLDIQYRALYPETITGAAIRFFDYYNPDVEGICNPVNIGITE